MVMRFFSVVFSLVFTLGILFTSEVQAQSDDDVVWIQVESHTSLTVATDRARFFAGRLEDVNGFAMAGNWYGIALGPYRRSDAEVVLRTYARSRQIPRDSFIQTSDRFRQQFWPIGANVLQNNVADAPTNAAPTPQAETTAQEPEPEVTQEPADETLSQARRSERDLTSQERKDLQIALKWAGFYTAAIDGSYGRGTRNSMSAWQEANAFEATGVLTTKQRVELLHQYNAVLDGLDLGLVQDTRAGIDLVMPRAEVAFANYEAPFARYDSTGNTGARVLLISQEGDQTTLFGLYDILQTLEIVPLDGPRERSNSAFKIKGENTQIVSETEVSLRNGQIKGFTLIWPAGDEERRTRVMDEMRKSFQRTEGVLDAAAGNATEQAIDLVAGLQIRKPKISRSGFFVDGSGRVATTDSVLQSCTRVTIDGDIEAEVLTQNTDKGVAILQPKSALAPMAIAAFGAATPRLQSEVSVAGYSYEGVLSAATLTFGALADVKGLSGESHLRRLSLEAQAGDAGGPVFDQTGAVLGMLLPQPVDGPQLPEDVAFALDAESLRAAIAEAGGQVQASDETGTIAPRDLRIAAQGMTVLVSCWE